VRRRSHTEHSIVSAVTRGLLDWVRAITGLSGDTRLLAIDHRVQGGLMYGLGEKGGIYTIKTPPQTSDVVVTKVSQLRVALYGTNFGSDFSPAADRLRVVSDNGQNLRHNLDDPTTVEDTTLTTPPLTGRRGASPRPATRTPIWSPPPGRSCAASAPRRTVSSSRRRPTTAS